MFVLIGLIIDTIESTAERRQQRRELDAVAGGCGFVKLGEIKEAECYDAKPRGYVQ